MGLLGKLFEKKDDIEPGNAIVYEEECDCLDESEALDVYDAADIWFCSGEDEDYMFGFTEEELRKAL